ncbi:PspC domain-containing protein [Protaetiibacter intestinalis]|nr:PspC domain-containing protein [Protaetiibacter intestinalis]
MTASTPLVRSRSDRVIGGVCAAVAKRFGWDVTLTRVLTVVAAFFAGAAIVVYVVLWIVVPEE